MRILLVGNGPSALAKEAGAEIDAFPGKVVRFNNYTTNRYEKWVGKRTDIWMTTAVTPAYKDTHECRYYVTQRFDEPTEASISKLGATRFPFDNFKKTGEKVGVVLASSGALATEFFLNQGHEVFLWGFDFLQPHREHHYNKDGQAKGENHVPEAEWLYFNTLLEQGKITHFLWDREKEGLPIIRNPVPCGTDKDVMWYREAAHNAWYRWFGTFLKGKSVLDVGCGCGAGAKVLLEAGAKSVVGYDIDDRLRSVYPEITTGLLDQFADNSFDAVTCVDVIEHVVEDKVLMAHMRRIAKELYLTTPNFTRSRCGNIAHCREYTISQFMNTFKPDEVWSASPDGSIHLTRVLQKVDEYVIDHSPEGADNTNRINTLFAYKHVPLTARFNYTVDGQEWAHIAAIWKRR